MYGDMARETPCTDSAGNKSVVSLYGTVSASDKFYGLFGTCIVTTRLEFLR